MQSRDGWSSRFGFLIAAMASAVGVGNIWKFPYMVGNNGGGAFIFIYLLSIAFIVVPVLIAELALGRSAGIGAPYAMANNAKDEKRSKHWVWLGWLLVISAFLTLALFNVVGGWILDYLAQATLTGFKDITAQQSSSNFQNLTNSPTRMLITHTIFMAITVAIVSRGVHNGIERTAKLLMPTLLLIMLSLVAYGYVVADLKSAWNFLFTFQLEAINNDIIILAIGQSFLSMSIGAGILMTYGAYLKDSISIPKAAFIIAGVDTFIALLAGLVIFPFVFANGLEPAEGVGLVFQTLPVAFGKMAFGQITAAAFFALLFFAAITSFIALLEVVVHAARTTFSLSQKKATYLCGFLAWLVGVISVFSFNSLSHIEPMNWLPVFESKGIFDTIDFLLTSIMLPLGGLFMAVFVGWFVSREKFQKTLGLDSPPISILLRTFLRFIVPIALFLHLAVGVTS